MERFPAARDVRNGNNPSDKRGLIMIRTIALENSQQQQEKKRKTLNLLRNHQGTGLPAMRTL